MRSRDSFPILFLGLYYLWYYSRREGVLFTSRGGTIHAERGYSSRREGVLFTSRGGTIHVERGSTLHVERGVRFTSRGGRFTSRGGVATSSCDFACTYNIANVGVVKGVAFVEVKITLNNVSSWAMRTLRRVATDLRSYQDGRIPLDVVDAFTISLKLVYQDLINSWRTNNFECITRM